jgi:hypothetical protein
MLLARALLPEQAAPVLEQLPFPLGDLRGMDIVLTGQLAEGFVRFRRLQGDLELELGASALVLFGHGTTSTCSTYDPSGSLHCMWSSFWGQLYRRGNVFTQEEATALIGKRVRAKSTWNSGLLKKGAEGTVTGVSMNTSSKGKDTWQVEITWDTKNDRYLREFPRSWFMRDIEVVETAGL